MPRDIDKEKAKQLKLAYQDLGESAFGQEVLEDIKKHCVIDKVVFHEDPRKEAFMLGRQEVCRYILNMITEEVEDDE